MKIKKKIAGDVSGFTLIEVLVATFILGVGLLVVAAGLANGLRLLADSPFISGAKEAAASIADELAVERDALGIVPVDGQRMKNINGLLFIVNIDVRSRPDGSWDVDLTVPYPEKGGPNPKMDGKIMYSTTTTIRN